MMDRVFTPKVVTANALLEGDAVWLTEDDRWTRNMAEAELITGRVFGFNGASPLDEPFGLPQHVAAVLVPGFPRGIPHARPLKLYPWQAGNRRVPGLTRDLNAQPRGPGSCPGRDRTRTDVSLQ